DDRRRLHRVPVPLRDGGRRSRTGRHGERRVAVERGVGPVVAARRRVGGAIGEVILWIAAVGGLVCIVLVILAVTANITLIMFRTGSMAPTIPAGSVAVVQQVEAAEVAVGDVVTVDRPGELPITHRVTSVSP